MADSININGVTYDADEMYTRTLTIHGVQPTDFEDYRYLNVLVLHKNRATGAGGQAQAEYRYNELSDLDKFHKHAYPYSLDVTMITASDKKGRQVQVIVKADFDNVTELELTPKKAKTAPTTQRPTQ